MSMAFYVALAPLIVCICSVISATYIYLINHEHLPNKVFIIFMISFAILTLLDFLQILTSSERFALLLAKSKYGETIIVAAIYLHLCSALTDNKYFINLRKYLIIPYLISVIFFIITLFTNLVVLKVIFKDYTYTTIFGAQNPLLMLFSIIFVISGLIVLIITYRTTENSNKRLQLKYIFLGMIITAIPILIVTQIFSRIVGYDIPGAIIFTLPMYFSFAYAILRYKLMGEVNLVIEEDIHAKPIDYELEPGYTYIVPESEPKIGFQLFAKTMKEGVHGIVITLRDPSIIRNKYGLRKTPIIWITNRETSELSVKRKDIASINDILKPFLEKSADSVILLIDDKAITSGIKLEDRASVLALSKTFFDTVVTANSRFIISVSPRSISSNRNKKIIKTKSALLEFNRLAALVFEEICNNILQFLIRNGYIKTENIQMHLNNLGKKDTFFKNIKCHRAKNPSITNNGKLTITNMIEVERLSKEIMIEKIKLFMSEFEKIETAMDLNSIASRAINKYGLSKNEFQLNIGDTYIIPGSDARTSFKIFSEFTAKDFKGLCITKTNPKKLMRKYALTEDNVTVFWLTDISESKKNILPPKLEHILSAIEGFLTENDDQKIILLDGIEYLIFYSGDIFDTVLGFLRRLSDRVSQTNALILIPLDPNTLTSQRMSLLTRSGMEIYKPT